MNYERGETMVDSKFFKGESKTVEFKAKLPDKSERRLSRLKTWLIT